MKILLIFLTCILLTCFVSASNENITLIYPQTVTAGNVFTVNLTLLNFTEDVYDIKININNGSGDINKIWDGSSWVSSCLSSCSYVSDIINTSISNSSIFSLNITSNSNGTANITVRVRDSSSSVLTFSGYTINITPQIYQTCTFSSTCGSWGSCSNSQQTRTCINTSTNCQNTSYTLTQSCSSSEDITLEIEWNEEDIVNNQEFPITITAENLENDRYAVRVWIQDDDENIISERYGNYSDKGDVWVSGTYYIYNFFKGPGRESDEVKLRLKEEYYNFSGDATIFFKIKNGDEQETSEDIEILEKEDTENPDENSEEATPAVTSSKDLETKQVITLGSKPNTVSLKENSIIYKSKTEYIREYAPYAFSIVCIIIMIFMLIDKKHK